jgi:hypothetical protein
MSRTALARTLSLTRLRDDDVVWRLLRADHAAVIAGILGTHLTTAEPRLAAAELYERVEADLEQLRDLGYALPRPASAYCAEWREAGYLVRRSAADSRVETLELSAGAFEAIRILNALDQPVATATESRLGSIRMQLERLAVDTDPDQQSRLAQLAERRRELDAEIARVEAGEVSTLDDARAIERARDVLAQMGEMPGDFARVRAEFETLSKKLREWVLDSEVAGRHVLDEIFRGVDLIADSPQGQSFAAFSTLVHSEELGATVDQHIDQILARDFAAALPTAQRRALRRFVIDLKGRSFEIHEVMARFARGLRQYVQSQEYQTDRILRRILTETMRHGVRAAPTIRPWAAVGLELDLSAIALGTVGSIALHDPSELRVAASLIVNETLPVDVAELRRIARETEIDVEELTGNVNAVLATSRSATIGQVLAAHPATQGLASVLGLVGIGFGQATMSDRVEEIEWTGIDGRTRRAVVPEFTFTGRIE